MEKITDWDIAEVLDTKEDILAHIQIAIEDNNIDFLFAILDSIPRAEGTKEIADELGLTREELLAKGNVAFLDLMGFRLRVESKSA
jgi:probable addiction module antidote protein